MILIYLLLGVIAIGVLLCSEIGKSILIILSIIAGIILAIGFIIIAFIYEPMTAGRIAFYFIVAFIIRIILALFSIIPKKH